MVGHPGSSTWVPNEFARRGLEMPRSGGMVGNGMPMIGMLALPDALAVVPQSSPIASASRHRLDGRLSGVFRGGGDFFHLPESHITRSGHR